MEHAFWHSRWQKNEIGFHEPEPNSLLVRQFSALGLPAGARVFVPLCGKSPDLVWLREQGCRVVACELSALAVKQFFDEQGLTPEVCREGEFTVYSTEGLTIWQGDFFTLPAEMIGPVDAVYDRAALIALPPEMRSEYASHLISIAGGARQLLVTVIYDQSVMAGPPFRVDDEEIRRLYGQWMRVELLESCVLVGGLKGKVDAVEAAWRLSRC